ncbi:MAG: hypothetical protein AAFX06_09250 [Planctomycetota bacterium]
MTDKPNVAIPESTTERHGLVMLKQRRDAMMNNRAKPHPFSVAMMTIALFVTQQVGAQETPSTPEPSALEPNVAVVKAAEEIIFSSGPAANAPTAGHSSISFPDALMIPAEAVIENAQGVDSDAFVPPAECQDDAELIALAVDIARRVVLAHYKHAGLNSIHTCDVRYQRQGDQIHTYARVSWSPERMRRNSYQSDVFASIVMTRGLRRVYRVGYKDNYRFPRASSIDETSPIVTQINDDFRNRDPLGLETEKLGSRTDVLLRRSRNWLSNLFSGDRDWHVGIAKDRPSGSSLK